MFTLHTLQDFALQTVHSTLYTIHSTLYTLHSALYILHFISLFTLRTPYSTLDTPDFTFYTPHSTLYTLHFAPHTLHLNSTLYTWHSTLNTSTPISTSQNLGQNLCRTTNSWSDSDQVTAVCTKRSWLNGSRPCAVTLLRDTHGSAEPRLPLSARSHRTNRPWSQTSRSWLQFASTGTRFGPAQMHTLQCKTQHPTFWKTSPKLRPSKAGQQFRIFSRQVNMPKRSKITEQIPSRSSSWTKSQIICTMETPNFPQQLWRKQWQWTTGFCSRR